ncbi:MAG: UDP-N-acetylmuramoyl-tripeptide--D-alanyl-D-alanine ligase, partial [Lachnospiraceae bacterium]|nr:UDP-N-acetylmuramoyl-tripeptide--D-alanyl-D-alanine ligase [Lachnospiraceae bacterium]
KIAVLADMLELGEKSPEYHFEVGLYAVDKRVDCYVFIGDLSWWIGRAVDQYTDLPNQYFRTNEEASSWLISHVRPDDIILFKGSNGMHLNEVIAALRKAVEKQ